MPKTVTLAANPPRRASFGLGEFKAIHSLAEQSRLAHPVRVQRSQDRVHSREMNQMRRMARAALAIAVCSVTSRLVFTPRASVSDVGKRTTFWLEYHLGNASNTLSDSNGSKGVYGRYVMRWYQSLGARATPRVIAGSSCCAFKVRPTSWQRPICPR